MRSGSILFVLLMLAACPPPEEPCQRVLVDVNGFTNGGFAGGVGGGPGAAATPMSSVGTPMRFVVFAPLSACASDTLRANLTVTDPENLPAEVTLERELERSTLGAVKASVSFTPTKAGVYSLQVAFEPSLGVRTVLLTAVADGRTGATTRVPIPPDAGCLQNATWPISGDTVACEERGTGFISVTSADGGVTRFAGEQLVVVDTTLWSLNGGFLERRRFEGGQLPLLDSVGNFPSRSTPALHDVDLAMRFAANGRLNRIRVRPDAGATVAELALDGLPGPPLAYFSSENDVMFRWGPSECPLGNCVNLTNVVGIEPGFVWISSTDDFGQLGVEGFTWAEVQLERPRVTLPHAAEFPASPGRGFERLPLWLRENASGEAVLVSVADGGVLLSAWPRAEVLRVGRNHVVLKDSDPSFVRVIQK
jgi:hypothetical protein